MFRSEGFYFVRIIYIFFSNTNYVNYNVKSFLQKDIRRSPHLALSEKLTSCRKKGDNWYDKLHPDYKTLFMCFPLEVLSLYPIFKLYSFYS